MNLLIGLPDFKTRHLQPWCPRILCVCLCVRRLTSWRLTAWKSPNRVPSNSGDTRSSRDICMHRFLSNWLGFEASRRCRRWSRKGVTSAKCGAGWVGVGWVAKQLEYLEHAFIFSKYGSIGSWVHEYSSCRSTYRDVLHRLANVYFAWSTVRGETIF